MGALESRRGCHAGGGGHQPSHAGDQRHADAHLRADGSGTHCDPYAHTASDAHGNPHGHSGADAHGNSHAHAHRDTDTDAHRDTDTDADRDTDAYP